MNIVEAYGHIETAENIVSKVRDNMRRNGHPKFKPLIFRANQILWALSHQRREINKIQSQNQTLGLAFLPALIWAGGIATFGAVSKWITDAYTTTASIKETGDLADKFGPDQAAALLRARGDKNTTIIKILWVLGLAISGYFLTKAFK